jgi:hypothetical protein
MRTMKSGKLCVAPALVGLTLTVYLLMPNDATGVPGRLGPATSGVDTCGRPSWFGKPIHQDSELNEGSPAGVSFFVDCAGGNVFFIMPGDFCTQSQGGWGSMPKGNNTGQFLHDNFETVFPYGFVIGDEDGVNDGDECWAIEFTCAQAVTNFLPQGGFATALTEDLIDPKDSTAGVLAGQLTAATINVAFDAAGIRKDGEEPPWPPGTLGEQVYVDCVHAFFIGKTVLEVLGYGHLALSGCWDPTTDCLTYSDISDALAVLNENFVDCDTNLGCLTLPEN